MLKNVSINKILLRVHACFRWENQVPRSVVVVVLLINILIMLLLWALLDDLS